MEELKPCPFCGVVSNVPTEHDEECYIRQLIMIAQCLINGHKEDELKQERDRLLSLWNTRQELTSHMRFVKRDEYVDEYECTSCGGHTWVPSLARPEFCCHCGAKVLDDVQLNVV